MNLFKYLFPDIDLTKQERVYNYIDMLTYLINIEPYNLRGGRAQLSTDMGVSLSNLTNWLNNKGKPNSKNFTKIKQLYKTWGGK